MNNIHDSTASIQHVTVVLVCPPELLVALVKISSLLLQLFGSSSLRVPIILEGNIYLTLLRLFPFLFLLLMRCLISLLGLCIIQSLFFSVGKKLCFKNEQTTGIWLSRQDRALWSLHAVSALLQPLLVFRFMGRYKWFVFEDRLSSTWLEARSHIVTFEMFIASLGHFIVSWIIVMNYYKAVLDLRWSSSQSHEVFSDPALFRLIIAQMCPFNIAYKCNTFL